MTQSGTQRFERSVLDTIGLSSLPAVREVRVDVTKPRLSLTGLPKKARKPAAVKPRCVASDAHSGLQSCVVKKTPITKKVKKKRVVVAVKVTATATDRAGNVTTVTKRVPIKK